jgi:hypothetical protein
MPEAGPPEVQPDKVAPALIVDSAAVPAIDIFRKSRLSVRMQRRESPKTALEVQHKSAR